MMEEENREDVKCKEGVEPIVIKNDYLLKSELTMRIALLLFFGWGISINLTPEADSLDELYRRMALGTAIVGVLWTLIANLKQLIVLIKRDLYIHVYPDKIVYEYVTEKGKFEKDILKKSDLVSITWSLFPYAVKDKENDIWITEIKDKDDKRWAYLFSPLYIIISLVYLLIFICLNKCKIKKYLLYRYKTEIIAIPSRELEIEQDYDFEWKSLINRYILKGASYAD
jgi:hypothetical protein